MTLRQSSASPSFLLSRWDAVPVTLPRCRRGRHPADTNPPPTFLLAFRGDLLPLGGWTPTHHHRLRPSRPTPFCFHPFTAGTTCCRWGWTSILGWRCSPTLCGMCLLRWVLRQPSAAWVNVFAIDSGAGGVPSRKNEQPGCVPHRRRPASCWSWRSRRRASPRRCTSRERWGRLPTQSGYLGGGWESVSGEASRPPSLHFTVVSLSAPTVSTG